MFELVLSLFSACFITQNCPSLNFCLNIREVGPSEHPQYETKLNKQKMQMKK